MILSFRRLRVAATCMAALVVGSCGGGGEVDNELAFRIIHAAPDAPAVNVLIDGIAFRSALPYKGSTRLTYVTPRDYAFAFQGVVPTDAPDGADEVVAEFTVPLEAGREYTLLAIGEGAPGATNPLGSLLIVNDFEAIPADTARLQFVHVAPDVPPVDVYLTELPDAPAPLPDVADGTPVVTATYGQQPAARQLFPAGFYVVRITPAGDPATVLFTSAPLSLISRFDGLVTVVADTTTSGSPVSLVIDSTFSSAEILDRDTRAEVRTVHASPNAGVIDVIGLPATRSFPETLFSNPANPVGIVLDEDNGRALVVDSQRRAVLAVDLATGTRTVLSDPTTPSAATPFTDPVAIALDTAGNRALVADAGLGAVIAVDLATGARSVLSDSRTPDTANPFGYPVGIAVDDANGRALLVDNFTDRVVAVSLATGARTIVSDASTPDATNAFVAPVGIALDLANGRALVADNGLDAILAVDLATGARTILSGASQPDTVNPFGNPVAITLDTPNGRALVVDNRLRALVAVNLGTGARTILSGPTVPATDNAFSGPAGLARAAAGTTALVIDARLAALLAVDLATGARTVLSPADTTRGLEYLAFTPYRLVQPDTYGLRGEKTAAPDPTTPLFGATATVGTGERRTVFLAGLVAGLTAIVANDQTRPVYTEGKLRIFDAAVGSGTIDVYILKDGETVEDSEPTLANLVPGSLVGHGGFLPASYTVTFTAADQKTPLAAPQVVNAAAGSAQTIMLVDAVRLDEDDDGKPPSVVVLDDLAD